MPRQKPEWLCGQLATGFGIWKCQGSLFGGDRRLKAARQPLFHTINLQPFIRFEALRFKDTSKQAGNARRYMGGFNYYVTPASQNFKITAAWERIVPNTAPPTAVTKNTNHFVVQLQFYYF
jgi:hypothetical protein